MTERIKLTPEQRDRLFLVTWGVAMWAAAPPIKTTDTKIPVELAVEARALLSELGYDWQAGRVEHLADVARQRQRNVERILADKARAQHKKQPRIESRTVHV